MQDYIRMNRDKMAETLSHWVTVPSIAQYNPSSGQPFGSDCAEMLRLALSDAEKMGFRVHNYDNYVGTVELNDEKPVLGIAGHLDVVPVEREGWKHNPWGGEIIDGNVYGRGSSDNKSACVSALYALLAYKKFYPNGKNIRIYYGCNEESGMRDFDYYIDRYEKKSEMPPIIVPDAGNNITYGQFGSVTAEFCCDVSSDGKAPMKIDFIESGMVSSVPGDGRAVIRGGTFR